MLMRLDYPAKTVAVLLKEIPRTRHSKQRELRIKHLNLCDNVVSTFLWDRGHKNGPELHFITESANDIIINADSKQLITILNCRVGQIKRLYNPLSIPIPRTVLQMAKLNESLKLNEV